MNETTRQIGGAAIVLPSTAPLIRITAGAGSAGQKTWNIRRPVTLIGAARPAHIVLRDKDVSKCHCVIVNTGTEVLLKDLHTSHGTYCNKARTNLDVLKDGDVITIGELKIQVAVRMPETADDDSGCGLKYTDPTLFPIPVTVRLDHTDQEWQIEEGVALIGRHKLAEVRVDHTDIASRHAVLFKFSNAPAIVDLGGPGGVGVNGHHCPMSGLRNGDRVAIGPCTISICVPDSDLAVSSHLHSPPAPSAAEGGEQAGHDEADPAGVSGGGSSASPHDGQPSTSKAVSPFVAISDSLRFAGSDDDSARALSKIESELGALQTNMASSWDRLNSWESQLRQDASKLGRQEKCLSAREAELEAQDAALRGQLHDLSRYHEQIMERERELAAQLARIQEEKDLAAKAEMDLAEREDAVARRADEARNREHVLAQRWARLQAAKCTHCGKPIRTTSAG